MNVCDRDFLQAARLRDLTLADSSDSPDCLQGNVDQRPGSRRPRALSAIEADQNTCAVNSVRESVRDRLTAEVADV